MMLFLVDTPIMNQTQRTWIRQGILEAAVDLGADLVELHVSPGGDRLFFIFGHDDGPELSTSLRLVDHKARVTEVLLVGAAVEEVESGSHGQLIAHASPSECQSHQRPAESVDGSTTGVVTRLPKRVYIDANGQPLLTLCGPCD